MYLLIKNDASIKGIVINKTEYKISQYGDDTALILNLTKESLLAALHVLETFGSMCGLQINTDRTKLIWIGKKRNSNEKNEVGKPLTWGEATFNLLGVNFSVNLNEMILINVSPIMKKLEHLFHVWKISDSIRKDNYNKNFCLIKTKLSISFFTMSWNRYLKKIESMFFKFIWNGKQEKIKQET